MGWGGDLWEPTPVGDHLGVKLDPHSRSLRKGRWLESGVCFSVATAVQGRRAVLGAREGSMIIESLRWLQGRERASIFAFVIMPDPVHLLLMPGAHQTVSSVMSSWKKTAAREIGQLRNERGGLWQNGFYDHAVRDLRDAYEQYRYIVENPVRAGLAKRPEDFELSSAHPTHQAWVDRLE